MRIVAWGMLGECLGKRLRFSVRERRTLEAAAAIAARAREVIPQGDEDTDMLLAEIEHSTRELLDDPEGRVLA